MKHTLSILAFMLPLLLTGQKSALEDYFKDYLVALNNLAMYEISWMMPMDISKS